MKDNNYDNLMAGGDPELSLESILAEFKAEELISAPVDKKAEHSHSIVMDALDQVVGEAKITSAMDFIASVTEETPVEREKSQVWASGDMEPQAEPKQEGASFSEFSKISSKKQPDFDEFPEETPSFPKPRPETATEGEIPAEERIFTSSNETEQEGEYAEGRDYPPQEDEEQQTVDLKQKLLGPILGLMSAGAIKREEKRAAALKKQGSAPELPPELRADKAARLYAEQAQSLGLRCMFATALSLVLIYLSYGLPAFGLLGSSTAVRSLVCLILLLVVMLVGLDVFTNGILSIIKGKPGAEALIAVSCLVSAGDAILIAATGNKVVGLPFCAVSALSMTFALWGSRLFCEGYSTSFRAASASKSPSVVLSEQGSDNQGRVLSRAKRPITGFVREAETADIFENMYRLFAPLLLIASLILSAFCAIASKKSDSFLHTLSACTAVSASFSAIFGFAFPFSVIAKRLARSGVAIAGYGGCSELGRTSRVVVTDTDIFPLRTVSIADIAISEGSIPDRVIAYTGSMIAASGMGIAPVFTELMKKNGCMMQKIEDFACHEGGGIVARVNGDLVYVGSSGFMHLMGVKIPKNNDSKTSVYTAVNDILAGIFAINYVPVSSVQRALVTLLRGRTEPVFAVKDFNITPLLVKQKFRLPTENYEFPPFADRYRFASAEAEKDGTVVAMFSRGGLNVVAGLAKRGRKLYNGLRICAALSILGAIIGLITMFLLCWSGAYASADCGNMMTFMLLWLTPVLVISLGLRR
ncbi:MAG: hypothetical protein RSB53_07245 [Oscillospiraceae bacterium]